MVGALSYKNLQILAWLCKIHRKRHVEDTWVPGGHASVRATQPCLFAENPLDFFSRTDRSIPKSKHESLTLALSCDGTAAGDDWAMSFSSGSCAPGFRRASGRRENQRSWSPVQYRQSPMAYEPPVYCDCECEPRRKAPRWISWSRQNPGRRYYACPDALVSAYALALFDLIRSIDLSFLCDSIRAI